MAEDIGINGVGVSRYDIISDIAWENLADEHHDGKTQTRDQEMNTLDPGPQHTFRVFLKNFI